MKDKYNLMQNSLLWKSLFVTVLFLLIVTAAADAVGAVQMTDKTATGIRRTPSPRSTLNLKDIPFKVVYETYCQTDGKYNWELFIMKADGSRRINLTNTPDLDEMYPHVSPDASRICFVVDEGLGRRRVRSVYYMNIDGTERVKVAKNARQPCWSPDGGKIAYVKGEYERYSMREYATSELLIYDIATGEHKLHPNDTLEHAYALCWSPDAKWFFCAIQGNTDYSDTILVFEADGTKVYDLEKWGVQGCRPDISLDGRMLVWGETDWEVCMGDFSVDRDGPRVDNIRYIFGCVEAAKIYHFDISPDGKYIVFSYGPSRGGQQVGGKAKGWNICVSDLEGNWVKITTDGNHNKEPDWVPIPPARLVTVEKEEGSSGLERILSHPIVREHD
ncbi:MAG: PD40 domain-containing protein [Sedimentisphaerales bacterium]|nr:PD40 domain-containing protein [Sedimentisphaerales bacterium]